LSLEQVVSLKFCSLFELSTSVARELYNLFSFELTTGSSPAIMTLCGYWCLT